MDLGIHLGVLAFGPLDFFTTADGDVGTLFAFEFIVVNGEESGKLIAFDLRMDGEASAEAGSLGGFGDDDEVEEVVFGQLIIYSLIFNFLTIISAL